MWNVFDTFVDAASDKGSLLRVVVVGEEMIRGKGGYVAMKKSIHLLVIMPVYSKVQASAFFSTSMALRPGKRLPLRKAFAVNGCCSAGDGGVLDISTQIQPLAFEYQCVQVIQWSGNPRGRLDFSVDEGNAHLNPGNALADYVQHFLPLVG